MDRNWDEQTLAKILLLPKLLLMDFPVFADKGGKMATTFFYFQGLIAFAEHEERCSQRQKLPTILHHCEGRRPFPLAQVHLVRGPGMTQGRRQMDRSISILIAPKEPARERDVPSGLNASSFSHPSRE